MKTKLEKRFSYSNCFVSRIPMNDSLKSLLYVCVKFWWQTRLDNEYERTNMRSKLFRAQINPHNRLKNILPLKPRNRYIICSYYQIFITAVTFGTIVEKETLLKSKKSTKGH